MAKAIRDVIMDTMSRYGNLIPDNLKASVAHEITSELVSGGYIDTDDHPSFVDDNSDISDKKFKETKLQDEINMLEKSVRLKAPGLTDVDKAYLEREDTAQQERELQQNAMAGNNPVEKATKKKRPAITTEKTRPATTVPKMERGNPSVPQTTSPQQRAQELKSDVTRTPEELAKMKHEERRARGLHDGVGTKPKKNKGLKSIGEKYGDKTKPKS